jgi:hypothetical protein
MYAGCIGRKQQDIHEKIHDMRRINGYDIDAKMKRKKSTNYYA